MRLLVVEDDKDLNRQLVSALEQAGYAVDRAFDGEEGHFLGDTEPYDAVVLDIGLPRRDGVTVLEQWRAAGRKMPVLILTARDRWSDKVQGFDAGADDYVTKPFHMEEVLARIRALLRRASTVAAKGSLTYADLTMDQDAHRVTRGARALHLGPTEYRLLEFFLSHPRRVFTREQVLDAVWGRDIHVELRTVDVHIRRLRKAINAQGEPDLIRTVRSAGYALDAEG